MGSGMVTRRCTTTVDKRTRPGGFRRIGTRPGRRYVGRNLGLHPWGCIPTPWGSDFAGI